MLPGHREIILDELALMIPRSRVEHVDQLIKALEPERIDIDEGLEPVADLRECLRAIVRRKSIQERPRMLYVGEGVIGFATNDPLQHRALTNPSRSRGDSSL